MGINFGSLGPNVNTASASTMPASTTAMSAPTGAPVTLDLGKGAVLDLTKRNPGLTKVKVGAGWDVAQSGTDFDLDISAFLLNDAGKITSGNDVIFYNHMQMAGIQLSGDNRTGAGNGDDETINVDLSAVPAQYSKIVFCVSIDQAVARRQTFGMVQNAYIRLMDAANGDKELCRFSLRDDYSTDTAVIFAELRRNNGDWDFATLGEGKQGDLNTLAAYFS